MLQHLKTFFTGGTKFEVLSPAKLFLKATTLAVGMALVLLLLTGAIYIVATYLTTR